MTVGHNPARVLYCESSADGTIGGSHYCLLSLLEGLDRAAFTPLTVFYEEHALIDRFRSVGETVVHPQDRPVLQHVGGWMSPVRRGLNLGRFLGTVADHVGFLRRQRIDLLHLNNSITRHQDWMLAARIARIPYVVHERGLSPSYTARDRSSARHAALVIPMSAWIRDHMVARGVPGGNIRVLYDGLDPHRVQVTRSPAEIRRAWNIEPGQRVIGIVGNVRPWKGQETVVRAFIEVARLVPDVVCLIVGNTTPADEAYKARLQAMLTDAGLSDRVRFTGYQREVPSFMNAMEFVIHASIEPEPFGMVVLEAMAQRKAVIGSRAGGPTESIEDGRTGLTFPPGDAGALTRGMLELLGDQVRCRALGEAGYRRLLDAFTMDRYMRHIHEVYRAVLARRPIPVGIGSAPPCAGALPDSA